MPIENEFKYVLTDDDGDLRAALRAVRGVRIQRIDQGYLTRGVRIRRTEEAGLAPAWDLTFKRKVKGSVVEIETPISEVDFRRLWSTREEALEKVRFKFDHGRIHWDVDYFGRLKDPYFIMAEAEMPEEAWSETEAPVPAPVLDGHVLKVVGKERGFSSRRLCNRKRAGRMLGILRCELEPRRRAMALG